MVTLERTQLKHTTKISVILGTYESKEALPTMLSKYPGIQVSEHCSLSWIPGYLKATIGQASSFAF